MQISNLEGVNCLIMTCRFVVVLITLMDISLNFLDFNNVSGLSSLDKSLLQGSYLCEVFLLQVSVILGNF